MRLLRLVVTGSLLATGLLVGAPAVGAAPAGATHGPSWQLSPTGSSARFRGLSVVDGRTAWASGSPGTVLRTVDGGRSWASVAPPGTADLQFRDIEAFDADNAVVLSIGEGEASRIYRTTDGGRTWTESFRNTDTRAFYDCVAFFDRRNGLAMSDPVDGRFRILSTSDGGRTWAVLPPAGVPAALPGEAGFAASGQCLVTAGRSDAWFASGGGARARVYHSADRGRTWTVSDTPLASSASAGVFGLAFRNPWTGVAIGGDYADPTKTGKALALTSDGGRTWREPPRAPQGYRSGVTWLPLLPGLVAVGPTGSDISLDGGRHWRQFDAGSFDTVDCARGSCWAAGEQGRVAVLRW